MNESIRTTLNGQPVVIRFTELTVDGDAVTLKGRIEDEPTPQSPYTGTVAPPDDLGATRPRIRSYELASALVRLFYEGEMVTGAVTHCTDRAWRVLNLEHGACWIPRNVLRWSEIAGQFCVVEQDWEPHWVTPTSGLDHYPQLFDPDALIPELQLHA